MKLRKEASGFKPRLFAMLKAPFVKTDFVGTNFGTGSASMCHKDLHIVRIRTSQPRRPKRHRHNHRAEVTHVSVTQTLCQTPSDGGYC